jgi:hypothetical protein
MVALARWVMVPKETDCATRAWLDAKVPPVSEAQPTARAKYKTVSEQMILLAFMFDPFFDWMLAMVALRLFQAPTTI